MYEMIISQNPLNNEWLCQIKGTPFAWYYDTHRNARIFAQNINRAIVNGDIKIGINEDGNYFIDQKIVLNPEV